jgi:hypothetical protein
MRGIAHDNSFLKAVLWGLAINSLFLRMTADIKQLADLAQDENLGPPLFAFAHNMARR